MWRSSSKLYASVGMVAIALSCSLWGEKKGGIDQNVNLFQTAARLHSARLSTDTISEAGAEVQVTFGGFASPKRIVKGTPGEAFVSDMRWTSKSGLAFLWGLFKYMAFDVVGTHTEEVRVMDGRKLMAQSGLSTSAFFERYGFVLLKHKTVMEPAMWHNTTVLPAIYGAELSKLIRAQLMPDVVHVHAPPHCKTRGGGTQTPGPDTHNVGYTPGVHQDFDASLAHYKETMHSYHEDEQVSILEEQLGRHDVDRYARVNFWRPIKPMAGPLTHMPIAFADPQSISPADVVMRRLRLMINGEESPSHQLTLTHNAAQRWYYFPKMTVDEVVAFKFFEHDKRTDEGSVAPPGERAPRSVFHGAFEDPNTPAEAKARISSDYSVVGPCTCGQAAASCVRCLARIVE